MTLEQHYLITKIVVGIGFIISIGFLAVQIRQNSYLLRQSMADQRRQRIGWLFETLCTDNDFWAFHRRIDTDWENFNEDERQQGFTLGMRSLRRMLDELVAYYDGQITEEEWLNLQWNLKLAATRPNFASAYDLCKDAYPPKVQRYWESLDKSREGALYPITHESARPWRPIYTTSAQCRLQ